MDAINKYNFGVIGNCSYLAYVDTRANINWLCLPRFDSSFIFGSLLDSKKGGEFSITPVNTECNSTQYYLQNTNILATEFEVAEGKFRVIDFAPRFYQYDRYFKPLMIFRKIEPIEGNPVIIVKCKPVGEYGTVSPEIVAGSNHIRYLNLSSQVRFTTDIPLNYVLNEQPFVLNGAQYIVFSYGVPLEAPLTETVEVFLDKTKAYWINWVKSTSIPTIYQDEVIRSALVLKLHQYEDTGAIIAAGTTSLPEFNGSQRTWDYRYCWMRDTYYTLNAFNNIGHFEELEKYFHFIQNIMMNEKQRIKPLYTILGNPVPKEMHLDLEGFLGNKPVRVGNNASIQVQNDVYGQLLVSLLPLFIDRRLNYLDNRKSLFMTEWLIDRIDENMDIPDSGLWEFGSTFQYHCYTYLFHWAGCMAGMKIGKYFGNAALVSKSSTIADKAKVYLEKCYDPKRKVYTQAIDSPQLDASNLQLVTMNYLDPKSERALAHIKAHQKELFDLNGLYFRYSHDELGRSENSFMICGFWYAECLAAAGQLDEAAAIIDKLLKNSNHLQLFSEDGDMNGGQWGNYPQTYSHVGLINSVYRLAIKLDKPLFI
jgi:GH15 family glucan-1,4-alpha-glucosidase